MSKYENFTETANNLTYKSELIGEKEHLKPEKFDKSTFKSVHDFIQVSPLI